MLKLVQYMYMQHLLMDGIHVAWKKRFNTALKYKFIWFSSRPSSRPFKTLFGECLKKKLYNKLCRRTWSCRTFSFTSIYYLNKDIHINLEILFSEYPLPKLCLYHLPIMKKTQLSFSLLDRRFPIISFSFYYLSQPTLQNITNMITLEYI